MGVLRGPTVELTFFVPGFSVARFLVPLVRAWFYLGGGRLRLTRPVSLEMRCGCYCFIVVVGWQLLLYNWFVVCLPILVSHVSDVLDE